jgi:hypothetical protein
MPDQPKKAGLLLDSPFAPDGRPSKLEIVN